MECRHCQKPLVAEARFCPNCGSAVEASSQPTVTMPPATSPQSDASVDPPASSQQATVPVPPLSSLQPPDPLLHYQPNTSNRRTEMHPAVVKAAPEYRSRRRGCFGCLTMLVLLLIVVGAGWIFYLRPYAHNIAQAQLDQALSSAVNQVPALPAQLPPGPIQIQENAINNLIVLNLAPSSPVQHPTTTITPNNIRIDFQVYGLPSAIAATPKVVNGQVVASNVTVEGVVGLIMPPEEVMTLLNKHLANAEARLGHKVQSVQLKDHEADLTLA